MKSVFHLHRPMYPPDFEKLRNGALAEFRFWQHKLDLDSATALTVTMPKGSNIEAYDKLGFYIKGFLLGESY